MHLRKAAATLIQQSWRSVASERFSHVASLLRDMTKCIVCQDECVQIVRCSNGHGVCVGCVLSTLDSRCPACRETRPFAVDTATASILGACKSKLRCGTCNMMTSVDGCEHHRAWCPGHKFVCPWSNCSHTVRARDMATHVTMHPNVFELSPLGDGDYHLLTLFSRVGEHAICTLDREVTVAISTTATHRRMSSGLLPEGPQSLQVQIRAYYPNPNAPAVTAVVRQIQLIDCEFDTYSESWVEEHRLGVVPPVIASRESVMVGSQGPVMTSRTWLKDTFVGDGPTLFTLPNSRPAQTPQLAARLRNVIGLRDMPGVIIPHKPMDPHTGVVLVHVILRSDASMSIGSIYDC